MILKEKTAIVTGGNKGIGRAISLAFAQEGADVVIAARDMEAAENVARQITKMGRRCITVLTDVGQADQVEKMVNRSLQEFNHIDILVNNAGILTMARVLDLEEKDWDETMDINVKGVFFCCKTVAKHMMKQKQGKIINVSSIAGKEGYLCMTHYCASKAGVIGFTKALSLELAPYNINVNAVCPGIIETDMLVREYRRGAELRGFPIDKRNEGAKEIKEEAIRAVPLGRSAQPEEVARVVLFLASEQTNYMTGQAINVTGGLETH